MSRASSGVDRAVVLQGVSLIGKPGLCTLAAALDICSGIPFTIWSVAVPIDGTAVDPHTGWTASPHFLCARSIQSTREFLRFPDFRYSEPQSHLRPALLFWDSTRRNHLKWCPTYLDIQSAASSASVDGCDQRFMSFHKRIRPVRLPLSALKFLRLTVPFLHGSIHSTQG